MDIGIRELKSKLSEYVARAASGETIRVTDRGVPRAVLAPLQGESRIDQGIREGWITVGPSSGRGVKLPIPGSIPDDSKVEEYLDADRNA